MASEPGIMRSLRRAALAAAWLVLTLPAAAPAGAAREAWTGSYHCGPSTTGGAYTSRITMLVDDGEAQITRESAQIKESMSGRVGSDGTLKLEGTGARKEGGSGWIYRFEGRVDGNRFEARGAMLSSNLASQLRECSMSLTKVRSSPSQPVSERAVKLKPSTETKPMPPAVAEALTPTLKESLSAKPPAEAIERNLDFAGKSDTATMEGTVLRGAPHRYYVNARRGQLLEATLRSEGARFDLYEPGSKLTLLSGGFIVQGSRLGATEGERLEVDLPADGKYLLLVRSEGDQSFYTLERKVERPAPSMLETWLRDERVWIGAAIALIVFVLFALVRRKRDRRLFRSG